MINLAEYLTSEYGKGFTKSNLYQFVQFYKFFQNIFHAVSGKSILLTWTHYRTLLRVTNRKKLSKYFLGTLILEVLFYAQKHKVKHIKSTK